MQAALGCVRRDARVGVVAESRTVDVVRGTAVVDVERKSGVGGGPDAERLGVGRGEAGNRIPDPPLDGRVAEAGRPKIGLVRRRHRRDRVRRGPTVGGILQRHVRGGQIRAGHPFQPTGLHQVAAVVERHGERPGVGPALAGFRRAAMQPHVDPAAVRIRLGADRRSDGAEIDRRAVADRRIDRPRAVRNESGRAQEMEIQSVGIEKFGIREGVSGPTRIEPLQIGHRLHVGADPALGEEDVALAGVPHEASGKHAVFADRDATDDVAKQAVFHAENPAVRRVADAVFNVIPRPRRVRGDVAFVGQHDAPAKRIAVGTANHPNRPRRIGHRVDPVEFAMRGAFQNQAGLTADRPDVLDGQMLAPDRENIAAAGETGPARRLIRAAQERDRTAGHAVHGVADHRRRIRAGVEVYHVARRQGHGADQIGQGRLGRSGSQSVVDVEAVGSRRPDVAVVGTVVDVVVGRPGGCPAAQDKRQSNTHHPNSRFHL